jgi:PD-(D/E)XK nuclease superfamily
LSDGGEQMAVEEFPDLTPSRVASLACLKRFHGEHVLRATPRQPFAQALEFGLLVHDMLKSVYNTRDSTPPRERDIEAIGGQAILWRRYPDPALRDADLGRAIGVVRAYLAQDQDVSATTIDVERDRRCTLKSTSLRPLKLGARFDRLIVRNDSPDQLVVRDYKTGAPGRVELHGACIMLAVACSLYPQYPNPVVEYDYLNEHGLAERIVVTFANAKTVWPELSARAVQVYSATSFPEEPGDHCLLCPFRPECQPDLIVELDDLDRLFA